MKLYETCQCGAALEIEYSLGESLPATLVIESFHRAHGHGRSHEVIPARARTAGRDQRRDQLALTRRR